MKKVRVRFSKDGPARYISHLDLNRLFMRAFMRAGVDVVYTQGFNPHPHLVFSPPLSLGFVGKKEVLDFSVEGDISFLEIEDKLNRALPPGVRVEEAAEPVKKLGNIEFGYYSAKLQKGTPVEDIKVLFSGPELLLLKRSKSGVRETDVLPMIKRMEFSEGEEGVTMECVLLCSPQASLNPDILIKAMEERVEGFSSKGVVISRDGFLCADETEFE